jgi:hypothetical protein
MQAAACWTWIGVPSRFSGWARAGGGGMQVGRSRWRRRTRPSRGTQSEEDDESARPRVEELPAE